jgi:hypothetical protein
MRCHGTKCPLLTAFFSLSLVVTFLPETGYCRVPKFACGFKTKKLIKLGEINFGPCPFVGGGGPLQSKFSADTFP